MRCSRVETLLPRYLDAALSPADREAVAAHLDGCPSCRRALAGLESSLSSLQRVSQRQDGPDLWNRFQRRLDQQNPSAECVWLRERLAALLDGSAVPSERAALERHLEACPACEREKAAYRRSLYVLEAAAGRDLASSRGADLWTGFTRRLGASLPCSEARDLLVLGDAAQEQGLALRHHLQGCASCAAEYAALERSLRTLERVARSAPHRDLWPAFAARLEQERATAAGRGRAASGIWNLRDLILAGTIWRQPLVPAALALGAAVFLVFGIALQHSFGGRQAALAPASTDERRVALGTLPGEFGEHPDANRTRPPAIKQPGADRYPAPEVRVATGVREAAAAAAHPRVPRFRHHAALHQSIFLRRSEHSPGPVREYPQRLASAQDRGATPAAASSPDWLSGLKVSYHVPSPGRSNEAADVPASLTTPSQQRVVQNEILHTVELFVGVEDAATRPFGSNANTR